MRSKNNLCWFYTLSRSSWWKERNRRWDDAQRVLSGSRTGLLSSDIRVQGFLPSPLPNQHRPKSSPGPLSSLGANCCRRASTQREVQVLISLGIEQPFLIIISEHLLLNCFLLSAKSLAKNGGCGGWLELETGEKVLLQQVPDTPYQVPPQCTVVYSGSLLCKAINLKRGRIPLKVTRSVMA